MKKTFQLAHEKIKYPRMVDAARYEIKKYIKRERRRELPENTDYWDFDCKFGDTEASAESVHIDDIPAAISEVESREHPSFYVEILARATKRPPRSKETKALPLDPEE